MMEFKRETASVLEGGVWFTGSACLGAASTLAIIPPSLTWFSESMSAECPAARLDPLWNLQLIGTFHASASPQSQQPVLHKKIKKKKNKKYFVPLPLLTEKKM